MVKYIFIIFPEFPLLVVVDFTPAGYPTIPYIFSYSSKPSNYPPMYAFS